MKENGAFDESFQLASVLLLNPSKGAQMDDIVQVVEIFATLADEAAFNDTAYELGTWARHYVRARALATRLRLDGRTAHAADIEDACERSVTSAKVADWSSANAHLSAHIRLER